MRFAWVIAALGGMVWAVPYILAQDSWWRLLVVLGGALAMRQALRGEWDRVLVLWLSSAAVLVKVIAMGAAQNAPLHTLWASSFWPLWAMAAFIVAGVAALKVSPLSTVLLTLVALSFGGQYVASTVWLDIASEGLLLGALLASNGGANGLLEIASRVVRLGHLDRRRPDAARSGGMASKAVEE